MSAQSRWAAIRPEEPSAEPNPGAGFAVGRVRQPRPEGAMQVGRASDWHPTVVNLLILVVLELIGYAVLRYAISKVGL